MVYRTPFIAPASWASRTSRGGISPSRFTWAWVTIAPSTRPS